MAVYGWEAPSDVSWVTPSLAIGGEVPAEEFARLARVGRVRRVVDLRAEDRDDSALLGRLGMRLLHLPTPDHGAIGEPWLSLGVSWVTAGLQRGEGVFVHCQHGIGRSILLAACVLVAQGDAPDGALRRLKQVRGVASPSPAQLDTLLLWTARHAPDRLRDDIGFDALAHIVYTSRSGAAS